MGHYLTVNSIQFLPKARGLHKQQASKAYRKADVQMIRNDDGNEDDKRGKWRNNPCIGCEKKESHNHCPYGLE
jgi:hypothetical protein